MKYADILTEKRNAKVAERDALLAELETIAGTLEAEARSAEPVEDARVSEITTTVRGIDADLDEIDGRIAELRDIADRQANLTILPVAKVPGVREAAEVLEDRNASPSALADAITRSLEAKVDADHMAGVRTLARRHASDATWARGLIARASDVYASAFAKMVTGREMFLTADEQRAAIAVGTNTQGGYLVPTHLDPTVMLTNSGTANAIRPVSRVVTLTDGNVWNGVTSAGVTASWDAELAEVSDDSPSFDRVSIPVYRAQSFVQVSAEAFADVNGLAADVLAMFADARDRLEATAHATGSGSGQPKGVFTALDADTNVEIVSTTAAAIGLVDLQAVYRAVPVRFRANSTWVMNPLYLGNIQALGTAVSASYSTNITEAYAPRLLGRPVVESDDAPSTQTTTVRDNEIVLGDFANFVIVDKPGSFAVSYIPHLFNTSNNLPDGRSGWVASWRTGSDVTNTRAFRLLQDKTSA